MGEVATAKERPFLDAPCLIYAMTLKSYFMAEVSNIDLRVFMNNEFTTVGMQELCSSFFPEFYADIRDKNLPHASLIINLMNYCLRRGLKNNLLFALHDFRPGPYENAFGNPPPKPIEQPTQDQQRVKLYEILDERCSLNDLADISFRCGIDWDVLEGTEKRAKIRALISYCANRNKLDDLAGAIRKARPDISL